MSSVFSDLVAGVATIDAVPPAVGGQRALSADLDAARDRLDSEYPAGYAAANEVQSVAFNVNIDGGTYKLTFLMYDGTTFETGSIDWNDNAAAIQTIVDTAATVIDGYVAGDITVSGGDIATANVVLTFDGDSVAAQNVGATTVTTEALTDGGVGVATPAVTVTTPGQSNRTALAALVCLGVLSGDPPVQGTVSPLTVGTSPRTNAYYPTQALIRRLANEAAIADALPALEAAILTVVGLSTDGR